jgi:hypothetical protein
MQRIASRLQTSNGRLPDSSATATAVSPELSTKQTSAMPASGTMSATLDLSTVASGPTPLRREKTCAATQSERLGAPALKRSRSQVHRRRHDVYTPSSVVATMEGAGPNSIAIDR